MLDKFRKWLNKKLAISDRIGFCDELTIEHYRAGKLIDKRVIKGRCPTNAGFALVADRVGAVAAGAAVTYLALGTNATAEVPANTALGAEIVDTGLARAAATVTRVTTTVTDDTLQLLYEWTATGVKILREIGAFNAAAAGTMLARKTYDAITTANTDHVKMTYKFPFTAA